MTNKIMTDKIEKTGNSLIHHGKENNRIYLMKLAEEDCPDIIGQMENLAINEGYSKIIAKVPLSLKPLFIKEGYEQEAFVKKFFNGKEDVCFLSKYFANERQEFDERNEVLMITQFCIEKANLSKTPDLDEKFNIKLLGQEHIPQMIEVYKHIFESYPFPIHDSDYIAETMNQNIDYFGIFEDEKLVSVASSEMDLENLNTEMTDFATLPDYRGNNFSYHLLKQMEQSAAERGLKTAYTIARAKSTGMNMTFAKRLYEFSGTLVNNTNICGNIETMNVWFKELSQV